MNIGLTGSSGLIGRHLMKSLSLNHNFIELDLRSKNFFDSQSEKHINDLGLVHLASLNSKVNSEKFDDEIQITKKLIQIIPKLKIKFCIFFSTSKVYGETFNFVADESSQINPICTYAKTKVIAENMLQEYCHDNNITLIILRLAPVISKHSSSNIGRLLRYLDKELAMPILSAGDSAERSYLSLPNITNAFDNLLHFLDKNTNIFQKIYNLSDSQPMSMNSLIKSYCEANDLDLHPVSMPDFLANLMFAIPSLGKKLSNKFSNSVISSEQLQIDLELSLIPSLKLDN